MSDNKRLALTTLEPQKVSDKQNKKPAKTIRISVILPESNEDNCPEFNYKEQLAAAKVMSNLKWSRFRCTYRMRNEFINASHEFSLWQASTRDS